jgi:hypothetical protein
MDIMVGLSEGQEVVDSDGKHVGKVRDFAAGEPEDEVSEADASLAGSGGTMMLAELSTEDAFRLSRSGWVRIQKGHFTHDRFLPLSDLDRVDGDKLWLKSGVHLK